jgi:3D (Asp-Asp-Asp) domain-containing protein/uncharacterized protein YabE (DUF348 family)
MRYMKEIVTDPSPRGAVIRWLAAMVMITVTILCLSMPAFAQTKYVITDGDNVIVYMSNSSDPMVVIEEAGLQLGESDTYTTQTSDGISEIHINRIQMITVQEGDDTIVVGSYGGTVADVLASLDLQVEDTDVLSHGLHAQTYDGMLIQLNHVQQDILEYEEVLPHTNSIYEDDSLAPGEEQVLVEGQDGLVQIRARVHYENGVEVSREILTEQVIASPVDGIILRGVDRSVKEQEYSGQEDYRPSHTSQKAEASTTAENTVNYVPGTNLAYSQLLDFQATAYYCPNPAWWNTTYTGTSAQVGTVAVDPNFIPLGTKMYIVSADGEYVYGYCTAEDIGGAIKGRIVDLYFNTYDECIQFGRRDVKIYILSDNA